VKPAAKKAKSSKREPDAKSPAQPEPVQVVGPQYSGVHRFGDFKVPADRQIKGFANAFG
jgi:hypothetical protein